MEKKRILFLAPSLAVGGAERVLVNLLKQFDFERYDVTLCLMSNIGVYFNEIPIQVKIINVFDNHLLDRSLSFIKRKYGVDYILKYFVRKAIKENYDIGISFSDGILTDMLLYAENRFERTISWVHSCYKSQASLLSIYTPARVQSLNNSRYNKIDNIVCVSKHSMIEFEELFGHKEKLTCIYNLFDLDTVLEKSKQPLEQLFECDIINIIAVGRLVEVKEYAKLVSAAKILSDKGLRFKIRIVGSGKLMNALSEQIEVNNLEGIVELLGSKLNPYPFIKNSDLLVVTSSSEALPTVVIEAMVLGLPIVATRCTGCVEISDYGKSAMLCDHTIEDIALKLQSAIQNRDLRELYGKRGIERIGFFDEHKLLDQIYKIIK